MQNPYRPEAFESELRQKWNEAELYQVKEDPGREKYYVLDMFPYPSGEGLHVGHLRGYIATDVIARMKHMQGFEVLHPMGWDAFGLPAENYAIEKQIHPQEAVRQNVANFKEQLEKLGLNYDWGREINTTDPDFVKWTQSTFLKMFEKGLVYESNEPINWCNSCATGLANEDVEHGACERCGTAIERRPVRQWKIRMTDYAERLLDDMAELGQWESSLLEAQRNWIGRNEGVKMIFPVKLSDNTESNVEIFTTRPETINGATFVVISPEHPFAEDSLPKVSNPDQVRAYIDQSSNVLELDRQKGKEVTGVKLEGVVAINPINGEEVPVFLADYVMPGYGTGSIMGVPAHDQRDGAFAEAFNIEVREVLRAQEGSDDALAMLTNSGSFDGLTVEEARQAIIEQLEDQGAGEAMVTYRLQDWVFSRQRFWGEPIPLLHCEECGVVPVPEEELPVLLPDVENYQPTGTGESPLASIESWVNTSCPDCHGAAKRETNTMPQWAGSSWYWLRYMDPRNEEALVAPEKERYWGQVDNYVGGADHATRHLVYARFWHKFLHDLGEVSHAEPFKKVQHVGLIMGPDKRKMSKRYGNVVNPDDVIDEYGADALRVYEMFNGDFATQTPWSIDGIKGVWRFLEKVWKMHSRVIDGEPAKDAFRDALVRKVGADIERFKFNTAIASMMEFSNQFSGDTPIARSDYEALLKVLHPFAPHLTEHLWENLGNEFSVYGEPWPEVSEIAYQDTETLVVMIDGKKVHAMNVPPEADEATIIAALQESDERFSSLGFSRTVYKPGKVLNFVTK